MNNFAYLFAQQVSDVRSLPYEIMTPKCGNLRSLFWSSLGYSIEVVYHLAESYPRYAIFTGPGDEEVTIYGSDIVESVCESIELMTQYADQETPEWREQYEQFKKCSRLDDLALAA